MRRQTIQPAQIIVVDDGSSDGTHRLFEADPDITFLRRPHRGVSAARNAGIAAAQTDWLAFLDSDDQWLPRKLEVQLQSLQASPGHAIVHCDEIWIRNGRRVNPMRKHRKSGGHIFRDCLPLCTISPSAVLLRRSLFDTEPAFDESLPACEDYDLWLRLCCRFPVLYVDRPLVMKYGGHADQLSRKYWGMDRFRIRALAGLLSREYLDFEDRRAAIQTMLRKIDIYLRGAERRGNTCHVREFKALASVYRRELRGDAA